ncbi:MAG TPA: 1,2-phenylacetyl-CoA epoxidase subunit PaaE [Taishania sp.]|nr:1,2-phenylacetyl-CoA epoxidase subunit PaaE [Taishania sp.]
MTPKFHTLKVKEVRRETKDAVSIAFDVPESLQADYQFIPGQYLTLRTVIDGEDIRRSYSLCSAPFENEWRVAVKQVEGGKFSTYVNTELKAGDELQVMTPMGNFQLKANPTAQKSYVLFAGGSGVTPILSVLKEILMFEPLSDVTFFYGNRDFASIIFREEIEALKNKYMNRLRVIHVLSFESLGNKIQKGLMDKQKCEDLYNAFLKGTNVSEVYVCGPEVMMLAVRDSFEGLGFPREKIFFELFTSSTPVKKKEVDTTLPKINANVQVILDGDTYDIAMDASETVLDAAYKAGADLPFACKGGVCCTCKAKILEGEATMDVNYALEPDEVAAGYILTCQARPTTEKLVVSFDD